MKRFRLLEDAIDVGPFLREIDEHPEIWALDPERQTKVAEQRETEAVVLFDHDPALTFRQARAKHPVTYVGNPTSVADSLPQLADFVRKLARRVRGIPGRAAVVRLRPNGKVYEHVDWGFYYQLRDRFHLVIKSHAGSPLRTGSELRRLAEGELWWFENRIPHEAWNESEQDRIHLIVDILTARAILTLPLRVMRSPGRYLGGMARRLQGLANRRKA